MIREQIEQSREAETRHSLKCPVCHRFIRDGETHEHVAAEIERAKIAVKARSLQSVFSYEPLPVDTVCRCPGVGAVVIQATGNDVYLQTHRCSRCDLANRGVCAKIKCGAYERRALDGRSVYFKRVKL